MPFGKLTMFWMPLVGDCFEEVLISGKATDVFGRAVTQGNKQIGIEVAGNRCVCCFDSDQMDPVIAKVVDVADRCRAGCSDDVGQTGRANGQGVIVEAGIGTRPPFAARQERIEVRVAPAHGGLDHQMQAVEPQSDGHQKRPRNTWFGAVEGNVQACNAHVGNISVYADVCQCHGSRSSVYAVPRCGFNVVCPHFWSFKV